MMNTYTIPQDRREDIEKLVARYQRKAAKYGNTLTVTYGEPYAVRVAVRAIDEESNTIRDIDTELVEAFDLTIDGDEIRKAGYTVIAEIEHMPEANIVYPFEDKTIRNEWRTADCRCEHCGMKRDRKVTFIVRHENGSELQVGRSCLKDYCGVDPQAIGYRNELTDILLGFDTERYDFIGHPVEHAYDIADVLAIAIRVREAQGYIRSGEPGSNKQEISTALAKKNRPTEAEIADAKAIIEAVKIMDDDDAIDNLLDNFKTLALNGYCKSNHFGYVAYAPVAYDKYIKKMEERKVKEQQRQAQADTSDYVGTIGKRMNFDIASFELVTSWEGQWGWTYLYKFIDTNGNVLVWFASSIFGHEVLRDGVAWDFVPYENVSRIKATVKDHNERDGVKQTVINRVKVA